MKIKLHEKDLPNNLNFKNSIAIDTETMGLNPIRDRLCLVQISKGDNVCHLVKLNSIKDRPKNLIKILKDKKIQKIFHYARFDVAFLKYKFKINIENIYCTKIASKLSRSYTDQHGYKDLCKEILGVEINKSSQSSDWGNFILSKDQLKYAATDVLYLHKIKKELDKMLLREGRHRIAKACFEFIKYKTDLDLLGWNDNNDIFKH
ncbi:MAG: Ribonuclease D [Alphaproteobacteria bacterium MarineAlpha5_Bin9]|nr:MAG: Ribonuclease D [Alphaproteobacteria bacterium MarineAlpha5_Bin9]|tara:strand:- start:5503 stop:6117 length:615 start_codon:yes stop_codon:yes gene_type:complete